MLSIMPSFWHVNAVPLQTKAVQQAMDQKEFHRAVEFRGRSVDACSARLGVFICD